MVDVLSTSPERYLSIDVAGTVRSEPIKGTRARSADPQADERLRQELAAHPKDRAENVMITDLVRNDLSIHAVPGTLRTERLCAVESYPTVHQMVSTVSARISPEVPRADVVAAAFPPGSMTGAPKISTMDILQRLETGPRGPYSGVAGYFSTTGAADLSVLIRTLVIAPGRPEEDEALLHLGLGGAIVADSDPADEWDEVVTKSAGVLGALGVEFPSR
ncbi:chorismate-binding protein [Nesterenkonia sp. PF2B19]|uniref:chorismate-binding protein n=1 Tax=Nesterenkonia sp. PF2B19 TaxID=1881858 RepID=UPI0014824799|nr:chorismate-binding protein [Nesterenkonia sp. PF2B19]